MKYVYKWLKLFTLVQVLLFIPLQVNAVTFDWQTEGGGWTAGALSKNYTNIAGSGIDANVTITGATGAFNAGFPDDDAEGLNLRVNYDNKGDSTILSMKFSVPVHISSLLLKDFDHGTYKDRAFLSAISTSGNVILPSGIILGSGVSQNAPGDYEANTGTNVGPADASGQINAAFTNAAITELRWTYTNGVDADDDPAQQFLWIDPVIFVQPAPALTVVKTSSLNGGTALPGDTITYTIVVSNNSTGGRATGVTLADTLPAGVTYVGNSTVAIVPVAGTQSGSYRDNFATASYNNSDGTTTWLGDWIETEEITGGSPSAGDIQINGGVLQLQDMDAGRGISRSVDLSIVDDTQPVDFSWSWEIINTNASTERIRAELFNNGVWESVDTTTNGATTGATGSETHTLSASQVAGVTAIRFITDSDVWGGAERIDVDNVSFTFTQINRTTTTLDNIVGGVNSDLNNGVPPNIITSGDNIVIEPDESVTTTFDVTVDANISASTITNLATVSTNELADISDTVVDNINLNTDLVTVKTVDNSNPNEGDTIVFTLTVTNNGPAQATNVDLNDTLPGGVTFSSANASQGSYVAPVWNIGTLSNGQSEELNITATVD